MGKVLHASYSGYFPFCLLESSSYSEASLEIVMKTYWRLRGFTISLPYMADDVIPNVPVVASVSVRSTAATEEELVCDKPWAVTGQSLVEVDDNRTWYAGDGGVYKNGDLYSPDYSIFGFFTRSQGGGFFLETSNITRPPILDLDGLQLNGFTGGTGISIIDKEYWSYDGTYNTSTGEPL